MSRAELDSALQTAALVYDAGIAHTDAVQVEGGDVTLRRVIMRDGWNSAIQVTENSGPVKLTVEGGYADCFGAAAVNIADNKARGSAGIQGSIRDLTIGYSAPVTNYVRYVGGIYDAVGWTNVTYPDGTQVDKRKG